MRTRRPRRCPASGSKRREPDRGVLGPANVAFEIPARRDRGHHWTQRGRQDRLLKVLSRITKPTTGRVEIHGGRVGSLLEGGGSGPASTPS